MIISLMFGGREYLMKVYIGNDALLRDHRQWLRPDYLPNEFG